MQGKPLHKPGDLASKGKSPAASPQAAPTVLSLAKPVTSNATQIGQQTKNPQPGPVSTVNALIPSKSDAPKPAEPNSENGGAHAAPVLSNGGDKGESGQLASPLGETSKAEAGVMNGAKASAISSGENAGSRPVPTASHNPPRSEPKALGEVPSPRKTRWASAPEPVLGPAGGDRHSPLRSRPAPAPRERSRDRSGILRERSRDRSGVLRERSRDRSGVPRSMRERSRERSGASGALRERSRDRSGLPRDRSRDRSRERPGLRDRSRDRSGVIADERQRRRSRSPVAPLAAQAAASVEDVRREHPRREHSPPSAAEKPSGRSEPLRGPEPQRASNGSDPHQGSERQRGMESQRGSRDESALRDPAEGDGRAHPEARPVAKPEPSATRRRSPERTPLVRQTEAAEKHPPVLGSREERPLHRPAQAQASERQKPSSDRGPLDRSAPSRGGRESEPGQRVASGSSPEKPRRSAAAAPPPAAALSANAAPPAAEGGASGKLSSLPGGGGGGRRRSPERGPRQALAAPRVAAPKAAAPRPQPAGRPAGVGMSVNYPSSDTSSSDLSSDSDSDTSPLPSPPELTARPGPTLTRATYCLFCSTHPCGLICHL